MAGQALQRIKCLGDAEIQQLDLAIAIDQHIAGLQIAVHQQVAVGAGHRVGQLQKQRQPGRQRQPTHGFIDGPAVYILQHKVGQALFAGAGIQQAGDVRVAQARQRLALLRKALQHRRAVHAAFKQFDRRPAFVTAVGAARFKHLAHATSADGAHHLPGAQALAHGGGLAGGLSQHGGVCSHEVGTPGGRVVVRQQAAQFGQGLGIQRSGGYQRLACGRSAVYHRVKQGLDPGPAGGGCCQLIAPWR